MNDTSLLFSERDLLFLIKTLIPNCSDCTRMMRVLRDDEEILEGMLSDEKLFKILIENPDSIIRVSPHLFFTVLLNRVKNDLKSKSFTVERQARLQMIVFDSDEVYDLVNEIKMRNYLADMLTSFVKINSFTIPIRVRKGVWRKFRFSDFDINSLIKYSQMIDEEQRYHPYKRIADICLFTIGIFPDFLHLNRAGLSEQFRGLTQKSREDFTNYGRYFYKAAARHKVAQLQEIDQLLMTLSENFMLAAKPLNYMVSQYLGNLKDELFLQ
jgi:hypothetical protein